jgi:glycosyltransferase involved in cell wall biosynthesis
MNTAEQNLSGKRIGFILGGYFGGAERQALVLARYLQQQEKAEVKILAWSDACAEQFAAYGIPWEHLPFTGYAPATRKNMIVSLCKYVLALRRQKLDILIPYCTAENMLGGIVWRWAGAKGCIWNQQDEGRERRPGRWERLAVKQTPCFVSNSIHGGDFLRTELKVPAQRIKIVYNGPSPELPESSPEMWRQKLDLSADVFIAGMLANLTPFKDHDTLLRAWKIVVDRLAARGQKAVLVLAGRLAQQHIPLKLLAYDLDLGRTVRFLGQVQDVTGLIRCLDLCVFSSRYEGIPNGVLECMVEGLAVAATDIPGLREAVGPTGYDFLAPPGNAELLAEKMVYFAENPTQRKHVGAINRERVQTVFSVEKMCTETTIIIKNILQPGGSIEAVRDNQA